MEMCEIPPVQVLDEKIFFRLVRTAFSQRRKTLSNSLKGLAEDPKNVLTAAGIDPRRRPETLNMQEFAKLADSISSSGRV
jgi:16S rRNA (adenine1518-N6/adenine1519-N6)-dimethyltransferase